ncbi:MAG: hypothetical protein M3Z84_04095, partial [Actinomycetota bacterium]|nr:hypothetical protein [Actinomycetota bacterium]
MSDSYWQTDVTWGAPASPVDDEIALAGRRPDVTAGPDWMIPPPSAHQGYGTRVPPSPSRGGGPPSGPTLIV